MKKYTIFGEEFKARITFPIEGKFKSKDLHLIDLSVQNPNLPEDVSMSFSGLDRYISQEIKKNQAQGAYGGYGEKRAIYKKSEVFTSADNYRNFHLGVDFWFPERTAVKAPLPGKIHSMANNSASGDYGPTIILEHVLGNEHFYTLYGHLSTDSLEGKEKGMMLRRGEVLGYLGGPEENVDWPPHLHFQVIFDLEGMEGDYPGVCYEKDKEYYLRNCPNPLNFLGGLKHMLN